MRWIIDDWKKVAAQAWSVRWLVLATALGALPEFVAGLDGVVSPVTLSRLTLIASCAALVSRFIKQPESK